MDEQNIFLQALEQPAGEMRDKWLDQACGGDSALRARIDALLARDAQAGSFLENPPSEFEATIIHQAENDRAASLEAGLAATFGQDEAVVLGEAGHSVLQSLGKSIDVPRVALRDAREEGPEPIIQPRSPEMPQKDSDSRYQLQGEIARGGMGAIIKGRDTDLGRDLAIKVLLDSHKDKPEVIQRFVEEAQIGGQLQHPGIAPIYELGQFSDQRPFFAMKLVKGETLSKLLADREDAADERGRFIGIFEQICQTMAYAHSRGVIHRDLKPANIMVGAFGEVQVMDWGLAKVLQVGGVADEKKSQLQQGHSIIQTMRSGVGSDSPDFGSVGSETQMGSVMGTPAYMPPEQALGEIDNLDERSDVFGLGAILCEILTGKPPYVADDGTRVFRMASRGKLDDCFRRLDDCGADGDLIALTKHCLELEPVDRPRDGGVLAERVAEYLESVETKLREVEIERAAQAARADAEAAQADAERLRADAECQRAEAESRRAEAEQQRAETESRRLEQQQQSARKLRKVLVGLAAVALLAAGTSIVAGKLWQSANIARKEAEDSEALAIQNESLAKQNARIANEQRGLAEQNLVKVTKAELKLTEQRNELQVERDQSQQNLYFAEMTLAAIAAEARSGLGRVNELLARWRPAESGGDRRGWEWYYLDGLSRREALTLHGDGEVLAVAYAPDGKQLATGGRDKAVRIWDTATGEELTTLRGHSGTINGIAWSPDGNRLVTASSDGTARVWEVASARTLFKLVSSGSPVNAVDWRPDGAKLATYGTDFHVRIWDVNNGRETFAVEYKQGWGLSLKWSPDGRRIAVGSWSTVAKIIDSDTGAILTSLRGHTHGVRSVGWSPSGDRVATASQDGTVRIWDPDNGDEKEVLQGIADYFHSVCWSPNGGRIAAGGANQAVHIWDPNTGQTADVLKGPLKDVLAVAWNPDGLSIAAGNGEGITHVWDLTPTSVFSGIPKGTAELGIDWAPDGRMVTLNREAKVQVWEPGSLEPTLALEAGERGSASAIHVVNNRVQFSPDGTKICVVGKDNLIRVCDAGSGDPILTFPIQSKVFTIRWSPDGTRIACSGWGWAIGIWDAQTGHNLVSPDRTQGGINYALAWSPSGDRLVTAGGGARICVWDGLSGQLITHLGAPVEIRDIAWSPDGRQIAEAGFDGTLRLWDVAAGKVVASLTGHSGAVLSLAWSPDGNRIASGGTDRDVKLWDLASGRETVTLRGHAHPIVGMMWHPDGCRLATRDRQGNVMNWDATQGFLAERSDITLSPLTERIRSNPADTDSQSLRAEVFARRGEWDAAASDYAQLAQRNGTAETVYPAGWWQMESADDSAPVFPPDKGIDTPPWLATASDPNGFVMLPNDGTTAICRVFAARRMTLALEVSPVSTKRLWLNGAELDSSNAGPILVELRDGWNSLAIRLGKDAPSRTFVRWRTLSLNSLTTMTYRSDLSYYDEIWSILDLELVVKLAQRRPDLLYHRTAKLVKQQRFVEAIATAAKYREISQVATENQARHLYNAACAYGLCAAAVQGDTSAVEGQISRDGCAELSLTCLKEAIAAGYDDFGHIGNDPDLEALHDQLGALFAALLANEPENRILAAHLADLLLDSNEAWTVVEPVEMEATGGTTFTVQEDGSILAGGTNPQNDIYTLALKPKTTTVRAIHLETLPDQRLPGGGSGRNPGNGGNFCLTGVKLHLESDEPNETRESIPLQSVHVDYSDPNSGGATDGAAALLDSSDATYWSAYPVQTQRHEAIFELASPVEMSTSDRLIVELRFQHPGWKQQGLGRFRLSVSADADAFDREQRLFAAMKLTNPWAKLAAAYSLQDDQAALAELLERHPAAEVGLADLLAADEDWESAINAYSQLITPETADTALLVKRAAAYIATEQWNLALADWERAVVLKPDLALAAIYQFQRAERWNEAFAIGEKLIEVDPNQSIHWLHSAPVAAMAGDETYRDLCQRCARQFQRTTNAHAAEQVTKLCLIKPGFIAFELLPSEVLVKALNEETAPAGLRPWLWLSRALLAYRSGDAESAVKYVANSEALKPAPDAHLLNLGVLALAEHELGQTEKSRQALEELSQLIAERRNASQQLNHNVLIAEIVFHEASQKINGGDEPSKSAENR